MPQEYYQEGDSEAILRIAAKKTSISEVPRAQLLADAAELGISPRAVEEAEQFFLEHREEASLREKFNRYLRRSFLDHLLVYAIVNGCLLLLNLATGLQDGFWVVYPILGWGLGLALHAWHTFLVKGQMRDDEFESWARKAGRRTES